MLRRIAILGILILFSMSISAYAGGSGNCIQPLKNTTDHVGMGVGFGCNYVGSRMNKLYHYEDVTDVKVNNITQVYATIPVGINEYCNIIGKIGGAWYEFTYKDKESDKFIRPDLEGGIYAGVGFNGLYPLKEWKGFSFGIGGDIQTNCYINSVKSINKDNPAGTITDEGGTMYAVDGQESIYLTARYDFEQPVKVSLIPYVGVYHNWIVLGTLSDIEYNEGKAEKGNSFQGAFDALSFGMLVGIDVEVTKYICLNIEGRFIGENAITTGATIKF